MNPLNTKNTVRQIKVLILLMALVGLVTGCGTVKEMKIGDAGFLTDYSILKESDKSKAKYPADWIYLKEGVNWKSYDKVMVDRVTYFFIEDSDYKGIQAEDLVGIAASYNEQFLAALKKHGLTITDKPGPNTLRIRTAITKLKPNQPVTGTITTVIPVGLGVSAIKKASTGTHIGMGEAGGEMELVDSLTGEILAAGIDESVTGQKIRIDKTVTKWGQVELATKQWAERATEHLIELRKQQQ